MFNLLRRKYRSIVQRVVLIAVTVGVFVLVYSFVDLEFCYRIMSQNSLTHMCKRYKDRDYGGTLCEEFCGHASSNEFTNFECPDHDMKSIVFTARKNGDTYVIKLAPSRKDTLSWSNRNGEAVYPKISDFHHIVKMHIILTFNVTLDDTMIHALISQEIDNDNREQMINFWRLFNDQNFMMSKLFEEDNIFPTVFASCGPFYATESLTMLQKSPGLLQFATSRWQYRLQYALNIMEYVFHLDEMRPEPLRMCAMTLSSFGLTTDKRLKYESASLVQVESQLDKTLSNGAGCRQDSDCHWHECMGHCNRKTSMCDKIQQNNNLQIFCQRILKGGNLSPGLLAPARTPRGLRALMNDCIDPSLVVSSITGQAMHVPGRLYAPNAELALRLYNELKRVLQTLQQQEQQQEQQQLMVDQSPMTVTQRVEQMAAASPATGTARILRP